MKQKKEKHKNTHIYLYMRIYVSVLPAVQLKRLRQNKKKKRNTNTQRYSQETQLHDNVAGSTLYQLGVETKNSRKHVAHLTATEHHFPDLRVYVERSGIA